MEYVEGKMLREMVPVKKMQDAIAYAIQIGEALQEAHSHGIVHRDIKAENIMVNSKNQIKVMDFGLAKLKGSLRVTKTSSTLGTLAYMAPEQIQGGDVDARSDIFSFGIVLYEMLTGRLPFRGEHDAAMMYSIVNDEPEPLQRYLPEISSDLVHVINRALDKDPEDRYQSAHDMVIDLRRLKKQTARVVQPVGPSGTSLSTPSAPPPMPWRKRRGRAVKVAALFAGLLLAVVCAVLFMSRGGQRLNRNPLVRTLEIPLSQIESPSISRDGNWIAFSALDESGVWGVYFMSVAQGQPRRLTTEPYKYMSYAEVSPDGSEILYDGTPAGETNGLYIVPSLGGSGRRIAEPGIGARWRPDARRIGYIRTGSYRDLVPSQSGWREFWTVAPDGTNDRLEFIDSLCYAAGNWSFDWSPDGKSIAWLRSSPGYEELIVRDLATGAERQLTSYKKPISEIAWSSNDEIFMATSKGGNSNIWAIPAAGGDAIQVTRGSGPDVSVRVSADVRRLLFLEQRSISHIWACSTDGSEARQITFDERLLGAPQFSPEGKRISVAVGSEDYMVPGSRIVVYGIDGSPQMQIAAAEVSYYFATWSPDGRYLAYGSRRLADPEDSSCVYLIDPTISNKPRLVGKGLVGVWIDKDHLVTESWAPFVHSSLYSVNSRVPEQDFEDSTLSYPLPGGRYLAVHDFRSGRAGWWLKAAVSMSEEKPRLLLPADSSMWPHLTPNLRYVVYEWPTNAYWRMSLPEGKRERVPQRLEQLKPNGMWLTLSPDGARWLFTRERLDARLVLMENVFE
jgi:Tol biopolymer transport system component